MQQEVPIEVFEIHAMLQAAVRVLCEVKPEITVEIRGVIHVFNVICDAQQAGKIIGKQGRNARALRTLLNAGSNQFGVGCQLNIMVPPDRVG